MSGAPHTLSADGPLSVIFDRGSELCRPVHFRFTPKS